MARRRKGPKKETTPLTDLQSDNRKPVITVDYERYAHFLDDDDLTETQKQELLQTIWNVVVEFVSLGFGVHPLQQVENASGEEAEKPPNAAISPENDVYLTHQFICENFENAAELDKVLAAEGVE